ncbi:hypothetical protein HYPSUDRAFT_723569 [Hypholoma sublateritium FD-334 SS-4]|uniref:HNH nuclease domain-containing protein n=1 Tax=Hypholoma sublateritium (strain FD-334 SS-4) TaxID=945553 RepID=A0A0D2L3Y8_HYPSF|nr:hypothetical protein HYPSUDRAFT_723569 [Hypholoma sublateritium FD-334 SS-4]
MYTYRKGDTAISVNLDEVMSAMLENAEECGGKDAKRYVAAAIEVCSRREDTVGTLAALGLTWLTHFLFVFKTSRSETQPDQEPNEVATPTLDKTTSHAGESAGHRIESFPDDVMKQDGHRCILTGFQDSGHPSPDKNIPPVFLKACHILQVRTAIGKIDKDHRSGSFMSDTTTFDILAN